MLDENHCCVGGVPDKRMMGGKFQGPSGSLIIVSHHVNLAAMNLSVSAPLGAQRSFQEQASTLRSIATRAGGDDAGARVRERQRQSFEMAWLSNVNHSRDLRCLQFRVVSPPLLLYHIVSYEVLFLAPTAASAVTDA